MAMGTRGNRLEAFGDRAELLAAQHCANGKNLLVGERRQIGEGALVHPPAFAIGLAQKIRRTRATVRDDIDVHGYIIPIGIAMSSHIHGYIMESTHTHQPPDYALLLPLGRDQTTRNFGLELAREALAPDAHPA